MKIRRLRDDDYQCFVNFVAGLSRRTYELWYPPSIDKIFDYNRRNKFYVLVYWHKWKIIGCAFFIWDEKYSDYPSIAIAVDDDYQGLGIGRKLMDALFKASINRGFKGLYVGVLKHNEEAIAFYTSLGFKLIGEKIAQNGEPAWEMIKE